MRLGAEEWMQRAGCHGRPLSLFFPEDDAGLAAAQQVCNFCPVRDECLSYAISNRIEHGVWGGLSERARRRLDGRRIA